MKKIYVQNSLNKENKTNNLLFLKKLLELKEQSKKLKTRIADMESQILTSLKVNQLKKDIYINEFKVNKTQVSIVCKTSQTYSIDMKKVYQDFPKVNELVNIETFDKPNSYYHKPNSRRKELSIDIIGE